ncbi:MAG: hypothetical protein RPU32_13770 [Candidatus Sedimenticola sp. (ex Thyasira tokunagai)]
MNDVGSKRGEIHFGDILCALKLLSVDTDEHAESVIKSLGYILSDKPTTQEQIPPVIDDPASGSNHRADRKKAATPPRLTAPPHPVPRIELPQGILEVTLKPSGQVVTDRLPKPDWLDSPADSPPEYTVTQPQPRNPLFDDNTSRGLLSAALATRRRGRELDIEAMTSQAVRGALPRCLPYRDEETLANGCQLLLQYSKRTVPWWDDLAHLTRQVRQVVGEHSVALYEFDSRPDRAEQWHPDREEPTVWKPRPGVPVLVACDLGNPASHQPGMIRRRWQPFIRKCERSGSPLLLLTPWPVKPFPEGLGRYPNLIRWHPRTRAERVRRVIGPGHVVSR